MLECNDINILNLDINLLHILSSLLETRNLSLTARRLQSSQPTVSRALARLRDIFEDQLLVRTHAGMELTNRAEELVEPLQRWLVQTNLLLVSGEFEPANVDRRFRIAANDFGADVVIAPALSAIRKGAPRAVLDIVPFTQLRPRQLLSGEIDLIVSGLQPDNLAISSRQLFTMSASCLMSADHPLARQPAVELSLEQLLAWPHINVVIGDEGFDRAASQLGDRVEERRLAATTPYFLSACSMLPGTDTLLIVPTPSARAYEKDMRFAVRGTSCLVPPTDYWLLWHERSSKDPATMWLVEQFAQQCTGVGA